MRCRICCVPYHWYCLKDYCHGDDSQKSFVCSSCIGCAVCGRNGNVSDGVVVTWILCEVAKWTLDSAIKILCGYKLWPGKIKQLSTPATNSITYRFNLLESTQIQDSRWNVLHFLFKTNCKYIAVGDHLRPNKFFCNVYPLVTKWNWVFTRAVIAAIQCKICWVILSTLTHSYCSSLRLL